MAADEQTLRSVTWDAGRSERRVIGAAVEFIAALEEMSYEFRLAYAALGRMGSREMGDSMLYHERLEALREAVAGLP